MASEFPEACRDPVTANCCTIIRIIPDRWNGLEKDRDNTDWLVLGRNKGTEMVPVFILVETNVIEWLVRPQDQVTELLRQVCRDLVDMQR